MRNITSLQHPLVKHLVKLKKDSSYRHEKKSIIIEGFKMISELPPKYAIKSLLTTKESSLAPSSNQFLVTEQIIKKISSLKNPEGILAEVELPQNDTFENKNCFLALDSIADPGNLGSLLRSSLAFGFEGIFLLDTCVDPFNDKALRAAKGATFHLSIQRGSWNDLKKIVTHLQLAVFVADTKGADPTTLPKQQKVLLVMGSESHGPQAIPKDINATTLSIPTSNKVESLNVGVAGAILMYLFTRII